MEYNFKEIETKWRNKWENTKLFKTNEEGLDKFYLLVMFAYPSGDIHMGHFRNYSVADVYARKVFMEGRSLLFPFGWDAFGLPAEGAAIKAGISPKDWTLNNIDVSSNTLKLLGIAFDWEKEVKTCLPDYYKWTQWVFTQFFDAGLAYQKKASANWCETCHTVLANEQVSDGKCWRCHNDITKKDMEQWFLKITDYSQKLLDGLDELPDWPENIKMMQRNWIGRSEGAKIDFDLEGSDEKITVFTTRPDTLCGVTFMAVAPESPIVLNLIKGTEQEKAVLDYIQKSKMKNDIERMSTTTEKDGVFSGRYAINPINGEKVEVWIGDYVLASYGTGAVMGVPAHDQRDFLFAKKYGVKIKVVIEPKGEKLDAETMTEAYTEEGIMVNSGEFNGTASSDGIKKVIEALESKKYGSGTINYRLRDWLVSRQRYWGAPIPIIHCNTCGAVPVPTDGLPVLLPEGKVDLIPKNRSPLADREDFMNVKCPKCGADAKRDPDTLDTFACSSWYHMRYTDPHNEKQAFSKENADKWLPVDLYIGGSEHACMHLIYFRFVHKFMHDRGFISSNEPAMRLFNHGMVLDEKGEIMSKSKGNVISPIHLMNKHGVDTTRLAMFFAAPSDKEVMWSDSFITGVKRFLIKFHQMFTDLDFNIFPAKQIDFNSLEGSERKLYITTHKLIKKVSDDIEKFQYNTAISALMEFVQYVSDYNGKSDVLAYSLEKAIQLLAPFAPHLAEELWLNTKHADSVFKSKFPIAQTGIIKEDSVVIVVQICGKLKERIEIASDTSEEDMKKIALENTVIKQYIEGKDIKKIIVVKGKLVNIVTS